ncbi:uncharacterized protein BP5553_00553 [Venustampulla echinocandica]|uniref:BBC1/AIM3 cysteine proteinase-fold domain-containing protein n=1 Tax=Venustampulla echinocandica TaxID=2656787 RepID=A0A370TYI3_9HELO|nr:uncharacterized protein BP5553_00553 [Venustampulla echinocandica]RDL40574.1 hypothetical protein BP5553_00553 [Venustampulla echinocandica]
MPRYPQDQSHPQRRHTSSHHIEFPLVRQFANIIAPQLRREPPNPPQEHCQHRAPPQSSQPSRSHDVRDLDLDLKSLWFTSSPPAFPPCTFNREKINYVMVRSGAMVGSWEKRWFRVAIRHHDTLELTKIHLSWEPSNPGATVTAMQRHYPTPRRLNSQELDVCRDRYANALASWCESKKGKRVGTGRCGELASEGLKAIAAKCISRREEPCMASRYGLQGYLLYTLSLSSTSTPHESHRGPHKFGVGRGDVLQMFSTHFKAKDGSEKWTDKRGHVAMVTRVRSNGALVVLEQNVGDVKLVMDGEYDMAEMIKGEAKIFRPVGLLPDEKQPSAADLSGRPDEMSNWAIASHTKVIYWLQLQTQTSLDELGERQSIIQSDTEPPPDGGYGSVCVAACLSINCFTWGAVAPYGVFMGCYLQNDVYPTATVVDFGFIGGLNFSTAMLVSPIVTVIARRCGIHVPMLIGITLHTTGFIMASFATRIWHLYLTQGILVGFGVGLIYIPSMAIPSQWFLHRRSLANGISAAGSGIGGLMFSLMTRGAISNISLAWALRITGIVSGVMNLLATIVIRSRNNIIQPKQHPFDIALLRRYEVILVLGWAFVSMLGYIILLFSMSDFAYSIGLDDSQAANATALLNLGAALTRPWIGAISDRFGRIETAGFMTLLWLFLGFGWSLILMECLSCLLF